MFSEIAVINQRLFNSSNSVRRTYQRMYASHFYYLLNRPRTIDIRNTNDVCVEVDIIMSERGRRRQEGYPKKVTCTS